MTARPVSILLAGLVAAAGTGPARGQVEAHFQATAINSGCATVDGDGIFGGDPERYPSLAIFDSTATSVFNACANGCTDDGNPATLDGRRIHSCSYSTGCGFWDFADFHLEKIVPNNSGAYFYFGLWDDDPLDPDDSLGDHWFFASSPSSGAVSNNNNSPYYADHPIGTVCGDVEGIGGTNNFTLYYSAWFEDQTAPNAPSSVQHMDDGIATFWDNDTTLQFQWAAGSDPHSGIAGYQFSLWSDTTGGYLFINQPATPSSMTVCPSGCTAAYTPLHANTYQFLVRALNGSFPVLNNQSVGYSPWLQFGVDLVNPTSSITSPPTGGWYAANMTVQAADTDSGSGLATCERRVISSGVETVAWSARSCNAAFAVSVGAAGNCRHNGASTCRVSVRSTDQARRVSTIVDAFYNVDLIADSIQSIEGFTFPGGTPIPPSTWVADDDPAVRVTPGTAISPLAGYSWAMGAPPDCVADAPANNPLSLQLAAQPDGLVTFNVRAIDQAGNCGPTAAFTFQIDTATEAITSLVAHGPGGTPQLFSGVWHHESAVEMSWTAPTSTSPLRYSTSTSGTPDCVPDVVNPALTLSPLPEGATTFRVRAIDEAGNCGAVAAFDLLVDTDADTISGLAVFTESGGATIAPATWTADNDPFVSWDPAFSTSPIAGYNVALDQIPDCAPATVGTSYQFPADGVANGAHTLNVIAIDQAGNCGFPASFDLRVDTPVGAGPGRITGQLRLTRSAVPGDLDLFWGPTCGVAIDYTVHEGVLGSWYSHVPIACSSSGALSITLTPGAGNRYYLVVPATLSLEGSYGTNSAGTERPASSGACRPQAPPEPCP